MSNEKEIAAEDPKLALDKAIEQLTDRWRDVYYARQCEPCDCAGCRGEAE